MICFLSVKSSFWILWFGSCSVVGRLYSMISKREFLTKISSFWISSIMLPKRLSLLKISSITLSAVARKYPLPTAGSQIFILSRISLACLMISSFWLRFCFIFINRRLERDSRLFSSESKKALNLSRTTFSRDCLHI